MWAALGQLPPNPSRGRFRAMTYCAELHWVFVGMPYRNGTTELCDPTMSSPLLNTGWAANDQKHARSNHRFISKKE